jgi:hypothetical protein
MKIEEFIWKNIICKFDVPLVIVVDNNWQSDDNLQFKGFYECLNINTRLNAVTHPPMNG